MDGILRVGPVFLTFFCCSRGRVSPRLDLKRGQKPAARLLRAGATLAKVSLPVLSTGGVPDADDTSGAVLALGTMLGEGDVKESLAAAVAGIDWLVGLANRDGGLSAFCRGRAATPRDLAKAERYLAQTQQADGSWLPLWFDNETHPD